MYLPLPLTTHWPSENVQLVFLRTNIIFNILDYSDKIFCTFFKGAVTEEIWETLWSSTHLS